MKFQDNYNMQIENMEDFILISYVMIDELYKQYAPQEVTKRKNVSKVKLSDSEIITISICGELAGIDSENSWYNFVKKNYQVQPKTQRSSSSNGINTRKIVSIFQCWFPRLLYCGQFSAGSLQIRPSSFLPQF